MFQKFKKFQKVKISLGKLLHQTIQLIITYHNFGLVMISDDTLR